MFKSTKITLAILSLGTFLFVVVVSFGLYHIHREGKLAQEFLNMAAQVEKKEALSQSLHDLKNSSSGDITAFEKITLNEGGLVIAIEKIEGAAHALGLDLKINSVDKVGEPSPTEPQKVRFAMELSGSWVNSSMFLKAIENLPYRVMFEAVSFEKGEKNWRSNIVLSLYSFKF